MPRAFGLVGRFAAASLVVFAAVGFAVHGVVQQQVRAEDQRNAQMHAVFITDSVLAPILRNEDLSRPLGGESLASVQLAVTPVLEGAVKRIKVWSPNNTIVFSDETRLIGASFDARDDFASTRRGPHSEISDLSDPENRFERGLAAKMFATYLRLPGATQYMVELYQDYAPTQAAINHTMGELDEVLLGALAFLYVLVLPIAWRANRRLRSTNALLTMSNDDLRHSEEELRLAYEREKANAERLRSLDDTKNMILTSVSHELRTPLTSIVGFAATLQRRGQQMDVATQGEVARRIVQQSQKLQRLLGDLLDVDRLGRGVVEPRREPIDVALLIRRVVEEIDLADHAVRVHADPITANVDPSKLERIVENLLMNAARHTPPGSSVDVRATTTEDGLHIIVDDNGPGVPPEDREAIFHPFVQGAHRIAHSPGTGVGLALVSGFAALHGGRAWVEQSARGGAAFHVTLVAETQVLEPGEEPEDALAAS
ncbi:MAG: sensor histidine kinase [Actinomycetota bacterium]